MSTESRPDRKRLLLHSCCGPCSTAVLERLLPDYQITLFYYNPNITDFEEYNRRKDTQLQVLSAFESWQDCPLSRCEPEKQGDSSSRCEPEKQGDSASRCQQEGQSNSLFQCEPEKQDCPLSQEEQVGQTRPPLITFLEGPYEPERFYQVSKGMEREPEGGKRCEVCFRLRLEKTAEMAEKLGFDLFTTTLSVSPHKNAALLNQIGKELSSDRYLEADFKKKAGYQRSIQLSKELGLYRQSYCGCCFGKAAMERAKASEGSPSLKNCFSEAEISKGEVSENGISKGEASENGISKGEASENGISKGEAAGNEISKDEASENGISKGEASENGISKGEASENEISKNEASENGISKNEASVRKVSEGNPTRILAKSK